MSRARRYWLIKSEPHVFSIDDLRRDGTTCWEGVRNYQARNFMRDDMKLGDLCIYYHSNAKPPGAVGIAEVSRESYPDHFAQDPESKYFDKKASADNPRWFMVDVAFVERWAEMVSLAELKANAEAYPELMVIRKGSRLSVQPVSEADFEAVRAMGHAKGPVTTDRD